MAPPIEKNREKQEDDNQSGNSASILVRIIACLLILGLGVFGFRMLKKMKKPPQQAARKEMRLKVQAVRVAPADIPVTLTGYGEVVSRTRVAVAAEIAGKVVEVHPRLEAGELIDAGELLFRQDTRDVEVEIQTGKRRLVTLRRDHELAEGEFRRARELFRKNRVGSLSQVEKLERAVNGVQTQIEQLEKALRLAEIRLSRSLVRAPFDCRLKKVDIEKGQYLAPGRQALVLVDDSNLEIQVPLDGREAHRWLRLDASGGRGFWFGRPEPVRCRVEWVDGDSVAAYGTLERIVDYDSAARMLRVAISLTDIPRDGNGFPLAEGMFCRVLIPGRTMTGVFALPRSAVDFTNTAHLAVDERLHSVQVETLRRSDELVYVRSGLKAGDLVITTRLDNPLENSLLQVKVATGTVP